MLKFVDAIYCVARDEKELSTISPQLLSYTSDIRANTPKTQQLLDGIDRLSPTTTIGLILGGGTKALRNGDVSIGKA